MFAALGSFIGRKPPQNGASLVLRPSSASPLRRRDDGDKRQSFAKVFRWRPSADGAELPGSVEIVGSFTQWQRVPLARDSVQGSWQVTLDGIPGNRTHHYMLLIDGKPTYDHTCDGLALPAGFEEEQFQLATGKGPRVLMLFSMTK